MEADTIGVHLSSKMTGVRGEMTTSVRRKLAMTADEEMAMITTKDALVAMNEIPAVHVVHLGKRTLAVAGLAINQGAHLLATVAGIATGPALVLGLAGSVEPTIDHPHLVAVTAAAPVAQKGSTATCQEVVVSAREAAKGTTVATGIKGMIGPTARVITTVMMEIGVVGPDCRSLIVTYPVVNLPGTTATGIENTEKSVIEAAIAIGGDAIAVVREVGAGVGVALVAVSIGLNNVARGEE